MTSCVRIALLAAAALMPVCGQQDHTSEIVDKAEQARQARDLDRASAIYRQALEAHPEWAEGWWRLGVNLYESDDFAPAAEAFEKAIRLEPQAGIAALMLGLSEAKLGRYKDALEHIRAGKRFLSGEHPRQLHRVAQFNEGLMLLHAGQFEEAQTVFGKLSKEGVDDEDLIVALGLSVLRIRPSNYPPGNVHARQIVTRAGQAELLASKSEPGAFESYRAFANEFSGVRNVQYAFGRFLLSVNREQDAIDAFKREANNSPSHFAARLAVAELSLKLHVPGGLQYAKEAVNQYPDMPVARALLGELLLQDNEVPRAIQELEAARNAMPDDARIHWILARAYAAAGRKTDAEQARLKAGEIRARQDTAAVSATR